MSLGALTRNRKSSGTAAASAAPNCAFARALARSNSLLHALLDDSARDIVQRWRFVPARRGTTPVDAWVEVPITFKLDS